MVISYDIKSDKRRNKIYTLLKDYGAWIQYSVFECNISEKEYRALRRRLKPLIKAEEEDSIRFYQLCSNCKQQIERLGGKTAEDNPSMIL